MARLRYFAELSTGMTTETFGPVNRSSPSSHRRTKASGHTTPTCIEARASLKTLLGSKLAAIVVAFDLHLW